MWVISPSSGADGCHPAVTGLVTTHLPPACAASQGRGPSVWRDDKDARGDTPCPPHTPMTTCAPPCPRHAPFPHWPEIVVAVTDAHTRAHPCPPPGRQGGHRRLSPPPVLNSSFLCSFFMFFPFSSFPPSPFLSCPPPHSSLSLSSLHFSKVSQPCPPHVGATRMGTPLRLGAPPSPSLRTL